MNKISPSTKLNFFIALITKQFAFVLINRSITSASSKATSRCEPRRPGTSQQPVD